MTTATQQISQTPAQRLAAKIRARTNDTRDILNLLHQIAQGEHDATEHDRLAATGILFDRGYGKCPKQAPATADTAPDTDHDDVGAIRESPLGVPREEPDSPRLVTQLDDSLHDSLGPAPEAESAEAGGGGASHLPQGEGQGEGEKLDPFSIQSVIRDHIISITNDGDTLIDVLADIAWPEDRFVRPFHRNRAGKMLLERAAGTDPTPVLGAVQQRPESGQSVTHHPEYPPGYIPDPTKDCIDCSPTLNMPEGHEGEHRFDEKVWDEIIAKLNQMEAEGIITPDPNYVPRDDLHISSPPDDWVPHPDVIRREAAAFDAEIKLRVERQKAWPEIEERRRKKLEQIYPSHSEDETTEADPPET